MFELGDIVFIKILITFEVLKYLLKSSKTPKFWLGIGSRL